MNIPEYWVRAEVDEQGREVEDHRQAVFIAFGWSDESMATAHKMAVERAQNIARRFSGRRQQAEWMATPGSGGVGRGQPAPGMDSYSYGGERPPREEIIERNDADGWVLTRNSYGCVVLNAAHVMFVDIDLEEANEPHHVQLQNNAGCLGALLGAGGAKNGAAGASSGGESVSGAGPGAGSGVNPAENIAGARGEARGFIERIADVVHSLDGMGVRLYRTAAGLRAVVTTEPYDPTSDLAQDTMRAFGVDPKYANLCRVQESFRARLTPKHWRCSRLGPPPARYPFRSKQEVDAYERWIAKYNLARVGHGVCEHLQTIGSEVIDEQVRPVLKLHDTYTLTHGDPLA